MSPPNIIFGCAGPLWTNNDTNGQVLQLLKQHGIKELDTAQNYGDSEKVLGYRDASKDFAVSTKFSGGWSGKSANRETIEASITESLSLLNTEQVDVYYLHVPDRTTPWKESLEVINELYQQGKFRRFGISNFLPQEVESLVKVAKDNGFVLPTVYQGNYSPVARKLAEALFPVLRKHGIAFYAYSPLAAGFLTKTPADIQSMDLRRFDENTVFGRAYTSLYKQPSFLEALTTWGRISAESNISKAELAYRWIVHHSQLDGDKGDGLLFGATRLEQISSTVQSIEQGPLPDSIVRQIDGIWDMIKQDAGFDPFNLHQES